MKKVARLMLAGAFVFAFAPFGYAQMTAPAAPATPAAPKAMTAAPKAMTGADDMARKAKAKECSAQADAQKLHGAARKAFREKCKKG